MGLRKVFLLPLVFGLLQNTLSFSQTYKYFIQFRDKSGSAYSLSNPAAFLSPRSVARRQKQDISITTEDLPVNAAYIDSVKSMGIEVLWASRWFNGVLVLADPVQISAVQSLPFVQSYQKSTRKGLIRETIDTFEPSRTEILTAPDYGNSFQQVSMIGVDAMHRKGIAGKGVLIAVIDGGFQNANNLNVFDSLFLNNRILATYDFVDQETDVFDDHYHGTQVLSVLGGYSPGQLIGPAWQASYLLLRSEDVNSETLSEEYNWVRAAEYADSAGADIISSSLGYNTFQDPSTNHTYADLNGDKTVITQAADLAASRGILVVNSAGNEGSNSWKYILAPADADSILSIGAVDYSANRAGFSSVGPSADGRIKPDLSAPGKNIVVATTANGFSTNSGTSLAAPLVSGLAAGIWEEFPYLNTTDLIYYLKRSASQNMTPDNLLGYGIPNYVYASGMILEGMIEKPSFVPNPVKDGPVVIGLPKEEVGNPVRIFLFDATGKLIAEQQTDKADIKMELNVSFNELQSGLYFISVIGSAKQYKLKIIKI